MQYKGFGRALRSTQLHRVDLDTLYARVGAVGTRSLLIWGRQDSVVPFKESERVRKAIPQIRFEPIDSAAHLPHMERTDLVNPILIDFLRGTTTSAGLVLPPPAAPAPGPALRPCDPCPVRASR
jgi:pimeloyl-ACP methyl ester carboxylesterase